MGRPRSWSFALGWPEYKERPFITWLKRECSLRGMSFLWVHDGNANGVIKRLETGKMKIKFLLDMNATYSVPYDKYARLCYAVKDSGGKVLNDPDNAKSATDKSVSHYALLDAGIQVPFTVVVRKWEPGTFRLTATERKELGTPFVIKPASGYGKSGVIPDARTLREVARARHYIEGDNFLLQEKIEPVMFGTRRAWFRVFYVLGEIIPCWWDTHWGARPGEVRIDGYEWVRLSEMFKFRLFPIVDVVAKIAELTKMEFFTTEIAIRKKGREKQAIAVDYVNDQCDLDVRSQEPNAPPDDVVEHIIKRIVEYAFRVQKCMQSDSGYSIYVSLQ